ncbi:MAG: hypothetical protein ACI86S_001630 [Paracoccaceae bacterium]|jgi:hypothetical protein
MIKDLNMRASFLLLPLLAFAACATPREQCIGQATRELRVINSLITETQGNLSRGYALVEQQDVRVLRTMCEGTNEDGSTFRFPCEETETFTRNVPVAIDLNAEQAKLRSLQERQTQEQRRAQAATQQCIAIHPE